MAECFSFFYLDNFEALSVVLFEFYCLYFLAERFDFGAVSVVPGTSSIGFFHIFLIFFGCWNFGFPEGKSIAPGDGTHLHQVASGSYKNLCLFWGGFWFIFFFTVERLNFDVIVCGLLCSLPFCSFVITSLSHFLNIFVLVGIL